VSTIKKGLPRENYTKISNSAIFNSKLSHGAFRVYCFFASMPNGKRVNDGYIKQILGITQSTLTRHKHELKIHDLVLVERLGPREYDLYVGHDKFLAKEVKKYWDKENI